MSQGSPVTSLPVELLLQIADHLSPECIYSLYHTNLLLHRVLHNYLYRRLVETHSSSAGLALLWACRTGNLALVRFLLDYQDSSASLRNPFPLPDDVVSFTNIDEETPLIAAVRGDRECILRIFRWDDYEPEYGTRKALPLISPEKEHREEITRLLLISGIDFDIVDENSKSALHYVSQYGDSDICRLLLCCGADAGGYDYGHLTPLHLAVYCNRLETVKVLLEFERARKTIDMFTEDDDTALIIAAEGGYTRIVEVLLAYGADFGLCNSLGESPLGQAAVRGNVDVVKVLLEHGARADKKNKMGRTLLEMAEGSGMRSEEVCRLLRGENNTSSCGSGERQSDPAAGLCLVR